MSPARKSPRPSPSRRAPIVTLLSDFGSRDGFSGIVKGIVLSRCPDARLIDLSHEIAPQDVLGGALVLASATPCFPAGTVHLAVVDPGVGSARRPIAVKTPDFLLVGPDNGLLSLASGAASKREVYHLDRPEVFRDGMSATFHARDLFAPVAARLASGVDPARLGTLVDDMAELAVPAPRRIEGTVEGQVIYVDRFGNLVTNLVVDDLADFRGADLSVSIQGVEIHGISSHYAEVREGRPVALWNSWGRLEVAICNGSAARHLRARGGERVKVGVRERR